MRVGIDIGGTFTDLVAATPQGIVVVKVPSTPSDPAAAFTTALGRVGPPDEVRHGTTVGTNAVLTRSGARLAFLATSGFRHILHLARQTRPSLYDLHARPPEPLVARMGCLDVIERVDAEGSERMPLDEAALRAQLQDLRDVDGVAVCFMHAYADPSHERRVGEILAEELPGVPVSLSSDVLAEFREYERASTTALNAYVQPVLSSYLGRIEADMPSDHVGVMWSGGGVRSIGRTIDAPVHTLLSGPAAGVLGAAWVARRARFDDVVTLDMGGTSADVALIDHGVPQIAESSELDGLPFRTPCIDIVSVGAGGGSIAWVDEGGALRVGPRSAGADPGPACYGRGGSHATVTDAQVVLGYLGDDGLAGGELRLDRDAAVRVVTELADAAGLGMDDAAKGVLRVVRATMARAIRSVSIERGKDIRRYALMPFGGAGPLHACALADELGIDRFVVPTAPGALAALGLLVAAHRADASVSRPMAALRHLNVELRSILHVLTERVLEELRDEGIGFTQARIVLAVDCRYRGQSHELRVPVIGRANFETIAEAFHELHRERYGFEQRDIEVEAVTFRATAAGPMGELDVTKPDAVPGTPLAMRHVEGEQAAVYQRSTLGDAQDIEGPALIVELDSTTWIERGWTAEVHGSGALVVARGASGGRRDTHPIKPTIDPVTLEVLRHALEGVADEMGAVLRRTSYSPNIKERADCSAAVFGPDAQLVAQAEHIPVHLGSMPASVAAALEVFPELGPGDQVVLNDPFAGGTHLNDLTLVAPVFCGERLIGYVANRAHHTDVGGDAPGSIPAGATHIDQEGIRISPTLLLRAGVVEADAWQRILDASRTPEERAGDLQAQAGANARGAARLLELAEAHGPDELFEIEDALQDYAAARVDARLRELPRGEWTFTDHLDDDGAGSGPVAIRCTLRIGDDVEIDFTGSDEQVPGNVNAVEAVAVSAACFVLRCLIPPDVPVNAGCWRSLRVIAPLGTVVNARFPAAVGAGNVEGSQRICDAIFGAFAQAVPELVPAASQGTMNNTLIGGTDKDGRPFSYYETIAGGQGGMPWGPGASGVHTNMTNTLNTPIEALEHAYPFRALRYELRDGSGGTGEHSGGDGVVREIEILADDATVTLITERRTTRPWGLAGGGEGAAGRNVIDGVEVPGKITCEVETGTIIRIETPGGGGWGS